MGIYECLLFIQHKVMPKLKIVMAKQLKFQFSLIVCIVMY